MSVLSVYVFLFSEFISVQSNTTVKTFVHDVALNGHICQEEHIVFQVNKSKLACSVKCLEIQSCSGIFFNSDKKHCTGCAFQRGIIHVTQEHSKFYKLEIKFRYIGCFNDNPRILSNGVVTNPSMTTEFCISYCLSGGNMYAMTEYSSECFCGNSGAFMDMDVQVPDTDCNELCSGNSNQICGGYYKGSVYHTGL